MIIKRTSQTVTHQPNGVKVPRKNETVLGLARSRFPLVEREGGGAEGARLRGLRRCLSKKKKREATNQSDENANAKSNTADNERAGAWSPVDAETTF